MSIKEVAFTLKVSEFVVGKIKKGIYVPEASATMKPIGDAPFEVHNNTRQL